MADLARTVFLPEDWNVPSDDNENVMPETDIGDSTAATEETVTLPPEILLKIAAIYDIGQIDRMKADVSAYVLDLKKKATSLESSVSTRASEVKAIEAEMAKLQKLLDKKKDEYHCVQSSLFEIKRDHNMKSQELFALEQQEKTIRARQLFDEFVASGKSMEEILSFLRGNPGTSDPLRERASLGGMEENSSATDGWEDTPLPIADETIPSESVSVVDKPGYKAESAAEKEQRQTLTPSKKPGEKQPENHIELPSSKSSFALQPEWEDEFNELWVKIESAQGQIFHTLKGLPFQYEVKGRQIFVNRKGKAITESSLRLSFLQTKTGQVTGPHSLKTFGASYVWSMFRKFGILDTSEN